MRLGSNMSLPNLANERHFTIAIGLQDIIFRGPSDLLAVVYRHAVIKVDSGLGMVAPFL